MKKRLHFMHMPKTGGTTLVNFLEKKFRYNEICPYVYLINAPDSIPQKEIMIHINQEEIVNYKFFKGHLGWLPHTFFPPNEIETITFLRDPVSRMISHFNYHKSRIKHLSKIADRFETFDEWVFDNELGLNIRANLQTKFFCSDLFFNKSFSTPGNRECKGFLSIANLDINLTPEQMLQLALERLHSCEFVGLTEYYNESFEHLCMQYKWILPNVVLKQNASSQLLNKNEISSKTLNYIMEKEYLDLKLYEESLKIYEAQKKRHFYFEREVLEENFLQNTFSAEEIKFNCEHIGIGEGWDAREGISPNMFIWNASLVSTLMFNIQSSTDLFISFRVIHSLLANLDKKLQLQANDFLVNLSVYFSHGEIVFEGIIPHEALHKSNFLELYFKIPELISPSEINPDSKDFRKLGFALGELEIQPIQTALQFSRQKLFEMKTQQNLVH